MIFEEQTEQISIHALLAESDDYFSAVMRQNPGISIHALLAESDLNPLKTFVILAKFLSTLSLRRATRCWQLAARDDSIFLSTLSLRRATQNIS